MPHSPSRSSLGRSARFRLSSRGHSTEAAYRLQISVASGPTRRKAFEGARTEWALCHGLEPDDGAYFGELRRVALTVKELFAALAVCGQTREMVSSAVHRLLSRGFLEQVVVGQPHGASPSLDRAHTELAAAEVELEAAGHAIESDDQGEHPRMLGDSLRHAVSRVVVARRFLEKLSGQD